MNTYSLSQSELDEINHLSNKIDNNTAHLEEYERYESLLLSAGLTKGQIRSKMNNYGYLNYQQYLEARANAVTKEHRKVVNVSIVAGLVVLSTLVMILIARGSLAIKE
jgi:hypothetical protein